MNREQQLKYFDEFTNRMRELLFSKGADYATEDVLSNFKLTGQINCMTPLQAAAFMISVKTVRLGNLVGAAKQPKNESVDDTLIDQANYAFLAACIQQEKQASAPSNSDGQVKGLLKG